MSAKGVRDSMFKILIVDDEKINRRIAEKMLGDIYNVAEVDSAKAAYEYLENEIPDLILLDIHMPHINGYEAIETLKSNDKWRDIPVVFLTADNDEQTEVAALQHGALDFLTKPFNRDVMIQRIEKIMDNIRITHNLRKEVDIQTSIARQQQKLIDDMEKKMDDQESDELTGMLIRNAGEIAITKAMLEYDGCFIFIDLDNLKVINDTCGHSAGDRLLVTASASIRKFTQYGISCRMGGDEFLVFMPQLSSSKATKLIEDIIEDFDVQKKKDETIKISSISAGIVMTVPGDDYNEVFRNADKALYYVKQNGKGSYSFYKSNSDYNSANDNESLKNISIGLNLGGSYDGAMEVEYRVFQRLYGYLVKVSERYDRDFKLVMISLALSDENANTEVNERELLMKHLGEAIKQGVRSVDIYTRFSDRKYLILMRETIGEGVNIAINRVKSVYKSEFPEDKLDIESAVVTIT